MCGGLILACRSERSSSGGAAGAESDLGAGVRSHTWLKFACALRGACGSRRRPGREMTIRCCGHQNRTHGEGQCWIVAWRARWASTLWPYGSREDIESSGSPIAEASERRTVLQRLDARRRSRQYRTLTWSAIAPQGRFGSRVEYAVSMASFRVAIAIWSSEGTATVQSIIN